MRTFQHLRVFVQTLQRTIEKESLPLLCLSQEPSLDDVRKLLQMSSLGDSETDVFFPEWTASLHIVLLDPEREKELTPSWDAIEQRKITVTTSEHLREIFALEEKTPGRVSIVLQVCRSKRYSRKEKFIAPFIPLSTSPLTSDMGTPPGSPSPAKKLMNTEGRKMEAYTAPPPMCPLPMIPEMYHMPPCDNPMFVDPYVPFNFVSPPAAYHPYYAVPIGVGYFGLIAAPPPVPHVIPGYYGYPVF